ASCVDVESSGTDHCAPCARPSLDAPDGLGASFFYNVPATTEIYTLSLHDALPIFAAKKLATITSVAPVKPESRMLMGPRVSAARSEEHTSELQSRENLVCRLLLEKKKITT